MLKYLFFLLLPLSCSILLCGCGNRTDTRNQSQEQEAEVQVFQKQLDSLEAVAIQQIQQRESQLNGLTAEDSLRLRREITYLREIQADIATEKDNLQVDTRQEWYSFRNTLRQNIENIKTRIDRTQ